MITFNKKTLLIIILSISLTVVFGCWNSSQSNNKSGMGFARAPRIAQTSTAPSFALPIKCDLGKDCFIMHYVDDEPSPEAVDFNCGRQTYDGHDGIDFGISDLQIMNTGVPVVAAAAGTVLRVRDGVADKLVADQTDKEQVAGQECGNGMVIDHGNGWETQYCHLKQNSVKVKPNTKVEPGTVLGMVGASGLASFPHVHFTVRYQGEVIDPFVGEGITEAGCKINKNEQNSLWQQSLNYVPTGLIRSGFSTKPPEQSELWQGEYQDSQLAIDSPALIFWVHTYGVLKGDLEKWKLIAPDGEVVINQENNLDKPYRSWVSYVGKRQIASGTWRGEYESIRGGRSVLAINREVLVD